MLKAIVMLSLSGLITQITLAATENNAVSAKVIAKVMVVDFLLNDLTDLPNPPEEIARTADFNQYFKQRLLDDGVVLVPVTNNIKVVTATQSATYLFDHPEIAADLAKGSGADYILIGVAMKPTYLFVYPRLLLVEIATKRKAFTAYVQMEGSWLEKTTTANSARRLAEKVSNELKELCCGTPATLMRGRRGIA